MGGAVRTMHLLVDGGSIRIRVHVSQTYAAVAFGGNRHCET